MKKEFYVETERLVMRLATEEDIDEVLDFQVRNRAYLKPYGPLCPESRYTRDYWVTHIPRSREDATDRRAVRFFIFSKEDEKRVIGLINYEMIMHYPMHKATVGYSMDQDEQGKGYITEALKATSQYMLRELNLMRIIGGYSPKNPASGRVMRKAGFHGEHLVKKDILINGRWEDINYLYLYNDEWIERKPLFK